MAKKVEIVEESEESEKVNSLQSAGIVIPTEVEGSVRKASINEISLSPKVETDLL